MDLRPYQSDAVECCYNRLRSRPGNTAIVIPTAGGKTPIMAQICQDAVQRWGGRVAVLSHVKELLAQTAKTILDWWPDAPVGIYSAGLKSRNADMPICVAGIQSVFRRPHVLGRRNLVLIDECQLLDPEGEGMYQTVLRWLKIANPKCRLIGLTATPYRMSSGSIVGKGQMLEDICYEIGVKELVTDKWISKVVARGSKVELATSDLRIQAGDFVVGDMVADDATIDAACREIIRLAEGRKSILIFCCLVDHAQRVRDKLGSFGEQAECVFGDSLAEVRKMAIDDFKDRKLRILVNVNVLTVGFDAPCIDCVVMLRPTMSGGLHYQMIGRGFRLFDGKNDCLLLDFVGNVKRHGPVDSISRDGRPASRDAELMKKCPVCDLMVMLPEKFCPECGHEFIRVAAPREAKHGQESHGDDPLRSAEHTEEYDVTGVIYSLHHKIKPDGDSFTLRVDYEYGLYQIKSEWVCIEHDGYAREKALEWWRSRSEWPMVKTIEQAIAVGNAGMLKEPRKIVTAQKIGEKHERVYAREIGDAKLGALTDEEWWNVVESAPSRIMVIDDPQPGSLEDFTAPTKDEPKEPTYEELVAETTPEWMIEAEKADYVPF